jgi:hypothetical protein
MALFAWSAVLGKILNMDKLRKRHLIMVNRCCLCKLNEGESIDHLLHHCEVTSALWNAIFSCFGLSWVMPNRMVDLFACLVGGWLLSKVLSCEKWFPFALCGAYGGKEIVEI